MLNVSLTPDLNAELLRSVMQTSVQAITVLNTSGEIVLINRAAERILGFGPEQLHGRKYNAPD